MIIGTQTSHVEYICDFDTMVGAKDLPRLPVAVVGDLLLCLVLLGCGKWANSSESKRYFGEHP